MKKRVKKSDRSSRVSRKKVFAKLNSVKLGLAGGIIFAVCVLATTIVGMYLGKFPQWIGMLLDIYGFLGYTVNWFGAVLGAVYGFVDGFVFFWLLGVLYNWLN